MTQCGWCSENAVTSVNVNSGRKLNMADACQRHADMVNREHETRKRERDQKARERKGEVVPWWRQ